MRNFLNAGSIGAAAQQGDKELAGLSPKRQRMCIHRRQARQGSISDIVCSETRDHEFIGHRNAVPLTLGQSTEGGKVRDAGYGVNLLSRIKNPGHHSGAFAH